MIYHTGNHKDIRPRCCLQLWAKNGLKLIYNIKAFYLLKGVINIDILNRIDKRNFIESVVGFSWFYNALWLTHSHFVKMSVY